MPMRQKRDGVESRCELCEQMSNGDFVRLCPTKGGVAWLSLGIRVSNQRAKARQGGAAWRLPAREPHRTDLLRALRPVPSVSNRSPMSRPAPARYGAPPV